MKFLSGLLIFCFSHLLKIKSIKHNTIITTITIIAVHTIPAKIPSKNAVASVVATIFILNSKIKGGQGFDLAVFESHF